MGMEANVNSFKTYCLELRFFKTTNNFLSTCNHLNEVNENVSSSALNFWIFISENQKAMDFSTRKTSYKT